MSHLQRGALDPGACAPRGAIALRSPACVKPAAVALLLCLLLMNVHYHIRKIAGPVRPGPLVKAIRRICPWRCILSNKVLAVRGSEQRKGAGLSAAAALRGG